MSVIIAPMSTWSGKSLGKVVIGDFIARGGMAEVYDGLHSTLRRRVAVKIMRDHVEEDPDSRARFAREARVVASLDHPNIIQIYDYDLVDGRPCIAMELVPGASLGAYLKDLHKRGEKLPHPNVARLLASIASALDYAHARNIVHRDIKPANILLRSSETVDLQAALPGDVEPVLTDFGLVRLLDSSSQTSTGTVSGTPAYMSPEQSRGDKVDHRTDIYSLGVVLYEMLAGNVPFDAESSFGVLMKHLNEPPPPIPNIAADLQAVINRSLAKDPALRYETAGELVKEFAAVLEGKSLSEKTKEIDNTLTLAAAMPQQTAEPAGRVFLFIGGALLLALAVFAGLRSLSLPPQTQAQIDPNQPLGRITYVDYNDSMDKAIITVSQLPLPKLGTHYEAWLLSQNGAVRRNLGVFAFDGEVSGQLIFFDPEGRNLLEQYDQLEITLEPNDDPNPNEPGGDVVASSIFPPQALVHVRHVLVAFEGAPDQAALIQGLWNAADSLDTSANELRDAFEDGDEKTLRLKIEEIINQLSGSQNSPMYKDWNQDGTIDDPLEGYGFLENDNQGYLEQTRMRAQFAANAPDASRPIVDGYGRLSICLDNMRGWGEGALDLALRLQDTPLDSGVEPDITELALLASRILYGEDANGNGNIEFNAAECGANSAYDAAYGMADMPLFSGPGRIPPHEKPILP